MNSAPVLRLAAEAVTVRIGSRDIVRDVTFDVKAGETVAVIGANGAGKSTLLKVLAGLAPPALGRVLVEGDDAAALDRRILARRLAYLPQERTLGWPMRVARVVALGRLPHVDPRSVMSEQDARAVAAALSAMDLDHLADRPANRLSGGELARVLLARTLAQEAPVLIADEPTAGLDMAHVLKFFEHLAARAAQGAAIVVAVHDLSLALRFCQRAVLLSDARVLASGPSHDVITPDNIAHAFGVTAHVTRLDELPVVLPARTLT